MIFLDISVKLLVYTIIIAFIIMIIIKLEFVDKHTVNVFTVLGQFAIIFGIGSYVFNYYNDLKTQLKNITNDLLRLNNYINNINTFLYDNKYIIPYIVYEFYNERGKSLNDTNHIGDTNSNKYTQYSQYTEHNSKYFTTPVNYNKYRQLKSSEIMAIEYILNQFYNIWTLLLGHEVDLEFKKFWGNTKDKKIDINKIFKKVLSKKRPINHTYKTLGSHDYKKKQLVRLLLIYKITIGGVITIPSFLNYINSPNTIYPIGFHKYLVNCVESFIYYNLKPDHLDS